MTPIRTVTVAGGGLAGLTVARELRSRGFDGTVRIVDPEGLPYDRPPLSKAYLAGTTDRAGLQLAPPDWFTDNDIRIIDDSVTKLDPGRGSVLLASGSELISDAVVLATGGRARRLPVPGSEQSGVLQLRTRADADHLRDRLFPGCRLVVVGAGLIAAEVASTATGLGAHVTLIDPVPVPLVPAVGEELARVLHDMHPAHGVQIMTGRPTRIAADGGTLQVDVELPHGADRLAADLVLVAIGIEPDTSLADTADLSSENGIEVTATGATSNPAIRAAGDGIRIRTAQGTLLPRSEHWEAAILSGTAVACGLLGEQAPQRPPAWFWSDRYGVHVEAVGSMTASGSTVLRNPGTDRLIAFRLDTDGVLVGCAAINGGKVLRAAKRLIMRRARVGLDDLADPAVDLRKIDR
ncbi:NAD(P)/FAD-dependent oxidoreductase [Nocardia jiangxiensis]|uniref:NAD(P)/FAD-dependent oxidoreductase n=1 Tax=Nocardia jiangxiensis TaxID=282685 RepID=UPI00031C6D77|nr:FAD-dependent oxidoreductase [Nocardia jiangxiensis]